MNTKIKSGIIIVVLLLVVAMLGGISWFKVKKEIKARSTGSQNKIEVMGQDEVKIKGTITDVYNGCWADGNCSIEIDDKWSVLTVSGGLMPPGSEAMSVGVVEDGADSVGKQVEVYAKKQDNGLFTIYGSEKYYVKIIEGDDIANVNDTENKVKSDISKQIDNPSGLAMKLNFLENEVVLLSEPVLVDGHPNFYLNSEPYTAKIISSDNDVLGEYKFNDPRLVWGEPGYKGPNILDSAEIVLIIPYFESGKRVDIFKGEKLMLSIDINL